jgi:peptide/nickel transport system permease protein
MIFFLQFDMIINYLSLILKYFGLLLSDTGSAFVLLNSGFIDASLSALLFLLVIPLIIIFRKRIYFISVRLNSSWAILVILAFIFLFAPVISGENPEFSKNLSVTKLLPPLSAVKFIELKSDDNPPSSDIEKFRRERDRIIKPAYNDNIIFADSIRIAGTVTYYQKNTVKEISPDKLVSENGKLVVNEKLFLLGTDELGRDLFSRLLFGTRISITIGFGAVLLSLFIGIILGFIAGYRGGIADTILNRFTETFLAFPVIYLVILILAFFGSSVLSVVIVLGISGWMSLFKIVKSEVLSIKQRDFFSTAELVGLKNSQLLIKEILPVIIAPVLVNMIFLFSNIVLAEAALSYLGLGIGNSHPSWGSMISSGQQYINRAWWLIAFPGLALILTVYSVNSSGRILGKILNPRLKI